MIKINNLKFLDSYEILRMQTNLINIHIVDKDTHLVYLSFYKGFSSANIEIFKGVTYKLVVLNQP